MSEKLQELEAQFAKLRRVREENDPEKKLVQQIETERWRELRVDHERQVKAFEVERSVLVEMSDEVQAMDEKALALVGELYELARLRVELSGRVWGKSKELRNEAERMHLPAPEEQRPGIFGGTARNPREYIKLFADRVCDRLSNGAPLKLSVMAALRWPDSND